MNKVNKIFLSLTSIALIGALASGIYLLFAKYKVKGKEIIQITNVRSSLTTECNLGIISPGESKEQTFLVESLVDKDVTCSFKFEISKENKATDYITINASMGDESLVNKTFTESLNTTFSFKNSIKEKESKDLVVKYTLAKDIPDEIIGAHLDFTFVFETNAFL